MFSRKKLQVKGWDFRYIIARYSTSPHNRTTSKVELQSDFELTKTPIAQCNWQAMGAFHKLLGEKWPKDTRSMHLVTLPAMTHSVKVMSSPSGRTSMKWQQYLLVSMTVQVKNTIYVSLSFLCSRVSCVYIINSMRPSDVYVHRQSNDHWFRWWLVACSASSHYLNQC